MTDPALETRVTILEQRVSLEAEMRAAGDRDLSDTREELRAHRGLLQALATVQSEHTATLAEHTATLAELKTGMGQIIGMLNHLIKREGTATGPTTEEHT